MKRKILVVLLTLSIIANVYLAFLYQPVQQKALQDRINNLEKTNAELSMQVDRYNLSLQNDVTTLNLYRQRITQLEANVNKTPTELQGFAELQAPAVMQRIERIEDYPFVRQRVVEEGSLINISVEIKPGKGRVLVQTKPLMGVVFQDAANTAVYVAQNKTGRDLSGSDVIFSIEAAQEIPSVDGPSAGALMALLVISAIEKREPRADVTLTGTIDQYGNVGSIGGVIEKATAAKDGGKNLFLIPRENSRLVQYVEKTRNLYGITITEQEPEVLDAKEYVETNVGIKVEYVDSIDDVLKQFT